MAEWLKKGQLTLAAEMRKDNVSPPPEDPGDLYETTSTAVGAGRCSEFRNAQWDGGARQWMRSCPALSDRPDAVGAPRAQPVDAHHNRRQHRWVDYLDEKSAVTVPSGQRRWPSALPPRQCALAACHRLLTSRHAACYGAPPHPQRAMA